MGSEKEELSRQFAGDMSLRALAYELKNPLVNIARQAELADKEYLSSIQETAEQTLKLIDSFLLNAQSEYGQTMLELEPTIIGSVLYDASMDMKTQAARHNFVMAIDDRVHEPVMTNRKALASILAVFGNILMKLESEDKRREIVLRGYKTRGGKLGVGLFGRSELTKEDVRRAFDLQGRAHMPLSTTGSSSHASLVIAEGLCRAIGGTMAVKHMGKWSGLATELPRSEQLSLV